MSLDDYDNGEKFDQFAGKKTSYRDDLYTTKIEEHKVTDAQKNLAA